MDNINKRFDEITDELAQVKGTENLSDISLEALNEAGDVLITTSAPTPEGRRCAERVIKHNEPLDFIKDHFDYPSTLTNKDMLPHPGGLKKAYFDADGYLWTIREDGTEERFRVTPKQRTLLEPRLKELWGHRFKGDVRKIEGPEVVVNND